MSSPFYVEGSFINPSLAIIDSCHKDDLAQKAIHFTLIFPKTSSEKGSESPCDWQIGGRSGG